MFLFTIIDVIKNVYPIFEILFYYSYPCDEPNDFVLSIFIFMERVKKIIVDKLGVDESEVTPEASFTNDLGADSLDTVELIMEFEKEFDVQIPDDQAENIATVGQAIAYIESTNK